MQTILLSAHIHLCLVYPTAVSKNQCSLYTFSSTQGIKVSMEPNFIVLNEPRLNCSNVNYPESAKYTRRALPFEFK